MKKKSFLIYILFFSLLFLSACSNHSEPQNKKVKVSEVTRSIFYAPQYVALGLEYFKEEGLEIELSAGEGSDKTMTAVLSSQADIGLLGSSSVISVFSQGKEDSPVLFSEITQKDGSFLVGRTNDFDWENLKGKKIIAGRKGGVPEMTLEYILSQKGIIPNQDVDLLNNIQFNLMSIAFGRGIGDYVALFEPTASTLVKEKNYHIVKALGTECGEVAYTGYCSLPSYIKKNPDIIQKFTKSIYKAQIWIKNHTPSDIAKIIAPYFVDIDLELLTECINNYTQIEVWCKTPYISENSINLIQEIMVKAHELDQPVPFEKIVTNKFAEAAVKEFQ